MAIRRWESRHRAARRIPPAIVLVLLGAASLWSSGCGFTHLHQRADTAPASFRGLLWQYDSPSAGVQSVRFAPDGQRILIRGSYACRVLDTDSGLPVSVFENEGELKRPWEYAAGALIAVPFWLSVALPSNASPGTTGVEEVEEQPPPRPGWRQNRILVGASDSEHAYYLDSSLRLRTWVLETGRLARPPDVIEAGASDRVVAIAPSADVFFVEEHQTGIRWLHDRRGVWKRELPAWSRVSFSRDGRRAAIAQPGGEIRVIDCANGHDVTVAHVQPGAIAMLSPDGTRMLVDERDREHAPVRSTGVRVMEVPSGRAVCELDVASLGIRGRSVAWSAPANVVVYEHEGESADSGAHDAVLVDLARGEERYRLELRRGERVGDLSSDGRFIVTVQDPRHVRLYKVLRSEWTMVPKSGSPGRSRHRDSARTLIRGS
jgi:hypothetical protein